MIKLIVGLGNPGGEYRNTLHNIGFWVVDTFVRRQPKKSVKIVRDFRAKIFQMEWDHEPLWLAKPGTFMNLSGNSVAPLAKAMKAEADEVLVIHDEADLDPGVLRFKQGGGAGGHKGLKSIFERWATRDFPRLRMGVGKSLDEDLSEHVLRPIPEDSLQKWAEKGADALELLLREGMVQAMNQVNRKPEEKPPSSNELDSGTESC